MVEESIHDEFVDTLVDRARRTLLDRCTSDISVTQNESFGPVLTVETLRH